MPKTFYDIPDFILLNIQLHVTRFKPRCQVPSSNYSDIEVEIDTVHGGKGETHTATLYLETYFN